jgi:hypothetical protein
MAHGCGALSPGAVVITPPICLMKFSTSASSSTVELYPYHGGHVIGDVEVRRERLQSNIASMVKDVLRTHITRGEISLDKPRD